ncbi:MAG: hypothetical protein IIA76_02520 [Proteobacteria bacterium]|nr:hypothetical protein [Pseudomonadota bacterium]MCH8220199.1 hypothetical protein [Pseudomonadota bacterium]MCH8930274.1 hypothetical protein [Pseudomonadota bacterium]
MSSLRITIGLVVLALSLAGPARSQELPVAEELPAYAGPAIAEDDGAGNEVDDLNPAVDTSARIHDAESGTLTTTIITGNAELPRVLYIVPWKKANPGDLMGKPVNSLLDDVLQPIDRGEFRRQLRYFDALNQTEASEE